MSLAYLVFVAAAAIIVCSILLHRRATSRPMIQRSRGLKYDIYLAGPMRGYPDDNHGEFNMYASILRALGHRVFSPAEMNDSHLPYEECMYTDINAVINKCKWVCLLPGWRKSEGTNVEVFVANSCGIPIMELELNDRGGLRMKEFDSKKFRLPYGVPSYNGC